MSQADHASTTRRSLFGGLAIVAGAAALPVAASSKFKAGKSEREFIQAMAFIHEDGACVAKMALACGLKPSEITTITMANGFQLHAYRVAEGRAYVIDVLGDRAERDRQARAAAIALV
ncbi:hypothetical protein [Caulobacter sp. RHG1]|uniref:hypothetical protein n=1 Tax=Caulobacter sp. (strain RHG1) TaxID=2545762 RepID=UPI001551F56A|nr:hypothetical protein [Caulobacter sp. RHG1]NQE62961.1 hypothetical protein [Caulobacter sp. RHG1]